jgi:predicted transcriptional regulator
MMNPNMLKIGIISRQDYINRTLAIAKGRYKPKPDEPQVWFESLDSVAEVLSPENRELLKVIVEKGPNSLKTLSDLTGRKSQEVSKVLQRLARYGIVEFRRESRALKPIVKATEFQVVIAVNGFID